MSEKKLWTYEEIIKQVKKSQLFSVDTKMGYGGITDSDERWYRLFKIVGDKFEEVDVKAMTKMIAEYLAKHVSLEKLF
ncbi:hypothetical protein KAU92_00950 [Candidatus Bathyarchaeota archaeon]|nr:hypothetical protein [Candidatus Bathyarchaeota archaeon]